MAALVTHPDVTLAPTQFYDLSFREVHQMLIALDRRYGKSTVDTGGLF